MKGAIANAFLREVLTFIETADAADAIKSGITVMLKSKFKKQDWPTYAMPLITVDIQPGSDSVQMLGGMVMKCWVIDICYYNSIINQDGYDTEPYSSELLSGIDDILVLFSNFSTFKSPEMQAAIAYPYFMRIAYEGDYKADPLEHADGTAIGEKLRFDIVAWQNRTLGTGSGVLTDIEQTPIDNG